jgi:hypothetical protein
MTEVRYDAEWLSLLLGAEGKEEVACAFASGIEPDGKYPAYSPPAPRMDAIASFAEPTERKQPGSGVLELAGWSERSAGDDGVLMGDATLSVLVPRARAAALTSSTRPCRRRRGAEGPPCAGSTR